MQNSRITFWRLIVIVVGLGLAVFLNGHFEGVSLLIGLAMAVVLVYLIRINK